MMSGPLICKARAAFTLPTEATFAVLLLVCLCSSPAFSQDDVLVLPDQNTNQSTGQGQQGVVLPPTSSENLANSPFLQFYEKWQDLEAALSQGNSDEAQAVLQQIVNLRRNADIPRMTEFAMSAIQQGDLLLAGQKTDEALKFYRAAAVLDPSLSYAYYSQSRAQLARGVAGYLPAIVSAIQGLLAPGSTLTGRMYFSSKWLLILVATGMALGFVFALIMLIKYNRLLRHDAIEIYGSTRDPAIIELAVWVFLFLPVLLFFGPLWLAPFWLMLFWGYCRFAEKNIAIVCFVVFLAAAPLYEHVAELSTATSDPSIAPYLRAFTEGASPRVIQDLGDYTQKHTDDSDAGILLAYLLKNESNFDASIQILQKHMTDYPSDVRAFNNLANIFFVRHETDSALRFLEKAQNINGRDATVLFNLSKGYRAKFDFDGAERLLEQARAADASLVRRLESSSAEQLVDMIPEEDMLWQRIRSKEKSVVGLVLNPFTMLTLVLLGLTFVLNLGKRKKQGFARKCLKCGKPFCKKCQSSGQSYDFCTQCLHIFVKKDGVSPASRKEKMQQIEQYSDRQRWFLRLSSLIVPGTGNLLGRGTISGIVVLLIWILSVVLLVFNSRYAFLSFFEPGENAKALTLFYVISMAVVYAIVNVPLILKSQKV